MQKNTHQKELGSVAKKGASQITSEKIFYENRVNGKPADALILRKITRMLENIPR